MFVYIRSTEFRCKIISCYTVDVHSFWSIKIMDIYRVRFIRSCMTVQRMKNNAIFPFLGYLKFKGVMDTFHVATYTLYL